MMRDREIDIEERWREGGRDVLWREKGLNERSGSLGEERKMFYVLVLERGDEENRNQIEDKKE